MQHVNLVVDSIKIAVTSDNSDNSNDGDDCDDEKRMSMTIGVE